MHKKILLTTVCLMLISLFYSASIFAAEKNLITTTGTVIALFDDNDKVVGVSIESADGAFYDVSNEGKGKELMALVEKRVEATGFLVEDKDGVEMLTIQSYKVLAE
ncbi:MAG: hypothetical protein JXR80_10740 [Deltaproteobacteria bacterium]|nr:hypothetical protein [Deltaproteobacteria bacterium]